ncbi:MAG: polysaccharide pyruvyl transferase family protein, partial [gamma proteobacterium symbiont of Lucinoma myriamae]|nr:polysaccharide pyruvyl transferase family protein [gamma proteobacterium symbiont of Lucinoma myriamae]
MKKDLSIVLIGASPETTNLGVSALLYSTMSAIFSRVPKARLTVFDFGNGIRESEFTLDDKKFKYKLCGAHNTRRLYLRKSLWNMRFCAFFGGLGNPAVKEIKHADLVLDISRGDSFTDLYGARRFNSESLPKLIAIQLKVPLVLLPQTYGPFNKKKSIKKVQYILENVKEAWARDERSFKLLNDLLPNHPNNKFFYSGIDVAFLLPKYEPVKLLKQKIRTWLENDRIKPVVGINVSGLIYNEPAVAISRYKFYANYNDVINGFIEKLLNSTDVNL